MWSWFSRLTTKKQTNQVDVRKEDENIRKEGKKKEKKVNKCFSSNNEPTINELYELN